MQQLFGVEPRSKADDFIRLSIKRAVSCIRAETALFYLMAIYFEYMKYILTNQLGKLIIVKGIRNILSV